MKKFYEFPGQNPKKGCIIVRYNSKSARKGHDTMSSKTTFQVYYDLLLQQLTQGSHEPVDLSAQNMTNALEEVNRQIAASGPDPNLLDRSFNTFCSQQQQPQNYQPLKPDSYTMADGTSRYEYAERCRREVMKNVEYRVRQTLEWRTATQRLGLVNQDGTIKNVSYGRWISYLMKTDDSEQSRQYNESVVALTALVRGDIQKDEYLHLREAHHVKYDNMSQEEAQQAAQNDFNNRAEFLYSEVDAAIEQGHRNMLRFKDASLAIQTGDFTKFGGSMEAAFDVYRTNSVNLAMVGLDMFADLRKFGLNRTEEQEQEITLRWQNYAMAANGLQDVADQVSNPYFAVFDPQKYYQYGTAESMIPANVPENNLAFSFMSDGISYSMVAAKELNQALKPYALSAEQEITADRTKDFRVFRHDDRTVILKTGAMTSDNMMTLDSGVPEQMLSQDFQTRVQALTARCDRWSKKHRTSREFENMRDSLTALSNLRLDQNSTPEQINAAAVGFEELRADAQAYMDRKLRQRPDQVWDGSYERNRVFFASDVLEFAEQKLRQIRYYKEHSETKAMRDKADMEDRADPSWRNDPRYAAMSPLEHKVAAAREAAQAEQAARDGEQRRQRAEEDRVRKEAENAYRAADGARNAAAYDKLFQNLGADAGDPVNASILAEAFIAGHKTAYDDHTSTRRNAKLFQEEGWRQEVQNADLAMFGEAKYIIAGYIIAELLRAEQEAEANHQKKNLPGEVDTPIRKLVNADKTQELAEAIINSSHFQAQFAPRLDDPAEMVKLFEGRDKRDRPTRRECFQAGRDFLNNMALAKQQEAQKEKIPEDQKEIPENKQEEIQENKQEEIQENKKENGPEAQKEIQEDKKENDLEDEDDLENEEGSESADEDEKDSLSESYEEDNPKKGTDEVSQLNDELKEIFQEAQKGEKSELSADHLLNRQISNTVGTYRRLKSKNSPILQDSMIERAQATLAAATLKYMVEQDSTGALANAVEKKQIRDMVSLVRDSSIFQERVDSFPLERMNAALENEELFCKPVGDALLAMTKDGITAEGQRLQTQKEPVQHKGQQPQDHEGFNKTLGGILNLARNTDRDKWAAAEREPYSSSPAGAYLKQETEHSADSYSVFAQSLGKTSSAAQTSAKEALALSTLQYMMESDPTQTVLENVVERGLHSMLRDMVLESSLFKKEFDKFDLKDTESLKDAFSDASLFAKPVGDQILSVVRDTLVQAAPKVVEQKKMDYFRSLKNKVEAHVRSSEAAQRAGSTVKAEQQGREALALQSATALLVYTSEEGKPLKRSVSALTEKVKGSKVFQSALKDVDLKDPQELREAISQGFGSGVAKFILSAENHNDMKKSVGPKNPEKGPQQKVFG